MQHLGSGFDYRRPPTYIGIKRNCSMRTISRSDTRELGKESNGKCQGTVRWRLVEWWAENGQLMENQCGDSSVGRGKVLTKNILYRNGDNGTMQPVV